MNPLLSSDRISKALGSSRVLPIQGLPSQGPLDLLRLAVEVKRIQALGKEEAHHAVRGLIAEVFRQLGIKPGDKLLVRRGAETRELNLDPLFEAPP